jgi:hypothetical protein
MRKNTAARPWSRMNVVNDAEMLAITTWRA